MIEIDAIPVNTDSNLPVPQRTEYNDLQEELASAILNRFNDTDKLQLRFTDANLTSKEKLEAIIKFKSALLIPSLRKAMGLQFSASELNGAYNVIEVLNNIEASIYNLLKYEQSEEINFTHPKIVASYRMLFEIIIEVMQEEIHEPVVINNIIEKVSVRCVGIEAEFNKRFKNISNKMAEYAINPILEPFKYKNDRDHVLKHLDYTIEKSVDMASPESVISALENKVKELKERYKND